MYDVEDLCLRYLTHEMSDSERVEFEEKLNSDPNLIIEYEMMRKTLSRVKHIPIIKTPAHLTAKIQHQASRTARLRKSYAFISSKSIKYAAAVGVIGLSFILGSAIKQTNAVFPDSKGLSGSVKSSLDNKKNASKVWIDKQDVLEIKDYNVGIIQKPDSLALKNAKKLRLIEKPLIEKSPTEEVLLTRTTKKP